MVWLVLNVGLGTDSVAEYGWSQLPTNYRYGSVINVTDKV